MKKRFLSNSQGVTIIALVVTKMDMEYILTMELLHIMEIVGLTCMEMLAEEQDKWYILMEY